MVTMTNFLSVEDLIFLFLKSHPLEKLLLFQDKTIATKETMN